VFWPDAAPAGHSIAPESVRIIAGIAGFRQVSSGRVGQRKTDAGNLIGEKIAVPIVARFELCQSGEANTQRARQAIFANKRTLIADAQRAFGPNLRKTKAVATTGRASLARKARSL
jgi:hypothetical protein